MIDLSTAEGKARFVFASFAIACPFVLSALFSARQVRSNAPWFQYFLLAVLAFAVLLAGPMIVLDQLRVRGPIGPDFLAYGALVVLISAVFAWLERYAPPVGTRTIGWVCAGGLLLYGAFLVVAAGFDAFGRPPPCGSVEAAEKAACE